MIDKIIIGELYECAKHIDFYRNGYWICKIYKNEKFLVLGIERRLTNVETVKILYKGMIGNLKILFQNRIGQIVAPISLKEKRKPFEFYFKEIKS